MLVFAWKRRVTNFYLLLLLLLLLRAGQVCSVLWDILLVER